MTLFSAAQKGTSNRAQKCNGWLWSSLVMSPQWIGESCVKAGTQQNLLHSCFSVNLPTWSFPPETTCSTLSLPSTRTPSARHCCWNRWTWRCIGSCIFLHRGGSSCRRWQLPSTAGACPHGAPQGTCGLVRRCPRGQCGCPILSTSSTRRNPLIWRRRMPVCPTTSWCLMTGRDDGRCLCLWCEICTSVRDIYLWERNDTKTTHHCNAKGDGSCFRWRSVHQFGGDCLIVMYRPMNGGDGCFSCSRRIQLQWMRLGDRAAIGHSFAKESGRSSALDSQHVKLRGKVRLSWNTAKFDELEVRF